jgi:hypothetical protein
LLSGHGGKQRRRKWDKRREMEEERWKIQEMKEGRREFKRKDVGAIDDKKGKKKRRNEGKKGN